MKIFLAGATGAIGRRLVPMLVAAGHSVTGTTQRPDKMRLVQRLGAKPLLMDALNEQEVLRAVEEAQPEVMIHQLTAIPANLDLRHFDEGFAITNRLRIEGTNYLLAAARKVGVRRFIAQSYYGWYCRSGSWIKSENDPLISGGISDGGQALAATVHLESAVLREKTLEPFVLRYGSFYGPGTSFRPGSWFFEAVQKRNVPIVGGGTGYWSFIHIDDAAGATVAAVHGSTPGIYNITDNEPAPVSVWLPFLAQSLGAKPPRHVPAWIARFAAGEYGVAAMTKLRAASNEKAKRLLCWAPRWESWRSGFRSGLKYEVYGADRVQTSAVG